MSSKPKRIVSIPVPGEDRFLVCTGGNFNGDGTTFSRVRVCLSEEKGNHLHGKVLTTNGEGDKCSYRKNSWALSFKTLNDLGVYSRLLVEHLKKNKGLY